MSLWAIFEHKYKLASVLDDISERGLPVDRQKQEDLREYITSEETRLLADLQQQIPQELLPANRKTGYIGLPKDLRALLKEQGLLVKGAKLDYYTTNHYDLCNQLGYYWKDFSEVQDPFSEDYDVSANAGLVKLLPFNPNSADQLLDYIRYCVSNDISNTWYVPRHIDTGRDTTGKEELDRLIEATDDPVLRAARQIKKAVTIRSRYCAGDWIPGPDGRVHGTFRFGTAVQQTSCSKPNIQQFFEHYDPDDEWEVTVARKLKACVRAEPGYKLVNVDMTGFHGRMQGWLSEDADYYRLASFDLHSFNTAQFVDHPLKNQLRQMNDVDLDAALKSIKKAHAHERNAYVKRVSFLNQYGGGADKASRILGLDIPLVAKVLQAIAEPFPKVFQDFPRSVDRSMREKIRLISPHGCVRYFWDLDLKQAVAFAVSNPAHCHIQLALVRLFEKGAIEKYGACNFPHDSLWFHCPTDLVDECIAVTKEEFVKPSEILINSLGPFWCPAEAKMGDSLVEMGDV